MATARATARYALGNGGLGTSARFGTGVEPAQP